MIGAHTAALEPWPRRLLFAALGGCPDVDTRQKWTALWPHLSALPQDGLRLLDAGCGQGRWALELAVRRPRWHIVGLDRVTECVDAASRDRARLGMRNVAFVRADLAKLPLNASFDVVLSVFSAHYLALAGGGEALFAQFRAALRPGGRLLALLPRQRAETPFRSWLPAPEWPALFSAGELRHLCAHAGLEVLALDGTVRSPGVLAKQLARVRASHPVALAGLYPAERLIDAIDRRVPAGKPDRSLAWVLIAQAPE